MATNNSINLPNGTTGQLVVGVTGAAGAYDSSASADFTFTTSTAGSTRTLTVSNTDNSNTASNAAHVVSVGGTSGGDPYTQYAIGTARSYSWGPDNSDSDILKINTGANATTTPSSGTNLWRMTSGGARIMPLQPAFYAYASGALTNVTGDGTAYTVALNTEAFDQGSNFASNTFTAPVTGIYSFCVTIAFAFGASGATTTVINLVTTGLTLELARFSGVLVSSNYTITIPCIINMSATNTATVRVTAVGGSKTVSIGGDAGFTSFSGFLVC